MLEINWKKLCCQKKNLLQVFSQEMKKIESERTRQTLVQWNLLFM